MGIAKNHAKKAKREKAKRAAELVIAKKEKAKLAAELVIAKKEKAKLAAELVIAKREKAKRAAELVIAKREKAKRAAELVIAKREKTKRAAELIVIKELDKLKDNFLSVTTHELKTPLIPIKAQAQLLLAGDYGPLNAEQAAAVGMIFRNEESLNILSSEVLDIAKIKSNKLTLNLEDVLLVEIIDNAVKNAKNLAVQKHIALDFLPFPELPKLMVDKFRIGQVINNLLDNAIKFTPEAGKVDLEVNKKGNNVTITVQDTGIGISLENQKKLFIPFFQIDSEVNRKYRGTGLGLAICKGIVEAHGGKIWGKSQGVGQGSTFGFNLPIKRNK